MNGEKPNGKNPIGWFLGHTPETSLLSQQAIISKRIPSTLPTYSWILTPIPNWICSVVTVPLFDARLPSTWLTSCLDPSTRLQTPTKKIVDYKVLQFIHTMKIKKMLGHKTLWYKYTATISKERDELGERTSSPITICLNRVCSKFLQLVYSLTALETIFLYV